MRGCSCSSSDHHGRSSGTCRCRSSSCSSRSRSSCRRSSSRCRSSHHSRSRRHCCSSSHRFRSCSLSSSLSKCRCHRRSSLLHHRRRLDQGCGGPQPQLQRPQWSCRECSNRRRRRCVGRRSRGRAEARWEARWFQTCSWSCITSSLPSTRSSRRSSLTGLRGCRSTSRPTRPRSGSTTLGSRRRTYSTREMNYSSRCFEDRALLKGSPPARSCRRTRGPAPPPLHGSRQRSARSGSVPCT
mmetsp:Transcript_20704/g.58203  ORF Transcript_20704/g.58203 Transcript_20704/m.58203 type:complete len:241 (-) Transcript_20704:347-1069(-)